MRKIIIIKNKMQLNDTIETMYEKTVTKFGSGAKIDCQKEHIGKKAYILIRKK